MGYVVRHSTSNVNKTRRRGKVAIGTDSSGYNKTSTSGVYNGVPPVEGKHNFVMVASGSEPDFYAVTDKELINFVNGLGERNLIKNNPIPTSTTSFGTTGTHSTSYDSTLKAVRWYQTGYASWGAYHYNTSTYYLEFDTGSEYSVSFEWKYGDDHNTGTAAFFQIVQGNGQNTVFGNYTLSSNSYLQDNGWYRFTATQTPNNQGYPETNTAAQFRLIIGNQGSNITDIYWRKLQLEKRSHTTDFANPDEVVSTVLEAQNYLLNRDDIIFTDNIATKNIVTDGLVLNLNAKVKSSFLDNKPTTNLINGGANRANGVSDIWYHGNHAGCNSGDYPNEYFSFTRPHVVRVESTNSTGYGMINQQMSVNATSGSVYTYSFDYKQIDYNGTFTPSLNVYGNGYKNPDSNNYYANLSTRNVNLDDGWKRFEATYTATYTGQNTFRTNLLTGDTADFKVLFDNFQIEEGSGTIFTTGSRSQNTEWKDLSGNNNNGTLTNGPTFSNGAIIFDGVNDYATISSDSTFNVNTRTVELTFKMNGSYSNFAPLAVYANDSSSTNRVWLGLQNSKFQMHGWGTSDPSATTTISANRWYTCVWTYDKSTQKMKMYTNGILENDHSQTQGGVNGASGMNWYLAYMPGGSSWQGQTYANVSFNSFKVYDEILSNSEVSQNYYGGDIVTNGLVYAMDAGNLVSYEEGSTTAYSMTGSITGTLTNGVAYTGSKGGAWVFDGSNDKITSSAPLSAGASTYTIEAIFKPASQKTQVVWEQNTSSLTSGRRVCMILISDGDGGFNGQSADRHDHMPYTVGEWHHWTITVDNNLSTNKIKMYANGELINQGNPSGTLNAGADSASIGSKVSTNTEYFDGDIGVVRVYNKVLTPSEVLQNYNAQKARFI